MGKDHSDRVVATTGSSKVSVMLFQADGQRLQHHCQKRQPKPWVKRHCTTRLSPYCPYKLEATKNDTSLRVESKTNTVSAGHLAHRQEEQAGVMKALRDEQQNKHTQVGANEKPTQSKYCCKSRTWLGWFRSEEKWRDTAKYKINPMIHLPHGVSGKNSWNIPSCFLHSSQTWRPKPGIPALRWLKQGSQEDHKFKAIIGYKMRFRLQKPKQNTDYFKGLKIGQKLKVYYLQTLDDSNRYTNCKTNKKVIKYLSF